MNDNFVGPCPKLRNLHNYNALQEEEHEKKRQKLIQTAGPNMLSSEADNVHNDFKRELTFYRQAQATVLEVIPRLTSMGVKTKRPDDYFAQMAKTDTHMNKVHHAMFLQRKICAENVMSMTLLVTSNNIFDLQIREKLVSKQATEDRLEKVRKLRELKKFGKKVQQEVTIKRAKEKREMLDQVILQP